MGKAKKEAENNESGQGGSARVKVLHTMDEGLRDWLQSERRKTGRSVSFILETAVRQYRQRIEAGRK